MYSGDSYIRNKAVPLKKQKNRSAVTGSAAMRFECSDRRVPESGLQYSGYQITFICAPVYFWDSLALTGRLTND